MIEGTKSTSTASRFAVVIVLSSLSIAASLEAQERMALTPFNWDLVSLEQNNRRFNASVLSGFHSIRSPGVTPRRAWKTGLGVLLAREEQVAVASNTKLLSRQQLILIPKLNYGFWQDLEAGVGFEAGWAKGEEVRDLPGGAIDTIAQEGFEPSAVDLGIKWGMLSVERFRLALSFDTRIAINRSAFGTLPVTLFNIEMDADYALTNRWSVIVNLQLLLGDDEPVEEEVIVDLATGYAFTDRFRGMLFITAKEDDAASTFIFFGGLASQYVFEQHSFTVAFDFQMNDARREIRTQQQLEIEFSYTYTF